MKASQNIHLCQVYGTILFACSGVFNIIMACEAIISLKLLYANILALYNNVDIPVDKYCFLRRDTVLSYSY